MQEEENWKNFEYVEIQQHAIEQQWVKEEHKKEIKKHLKTNKNENTHTKIYGMQE